MKVDVKVGGLLDILQKNREEHIKISEDAFVGWHLQLAGACGGMLKRAKENNLRDINVHSNSVTKLLRDRPESHVGDYDSAIGMLGMAVSDTITLSQDEYRKYVMDEWDWKHDWSSNSSSYSSSSSTSSAPAE